MSNGDDVLDDWEEIDEAGLTNTLNKIQAERKIQQQTSSAANVTDPFATAGDYPTSADNSVYSAAAPTMKLLQRSAAVPPCVSATGSSDAALNDSASSDSLKSPLDDMAATFQPVMMVLHKPADEYQGANYQPAINSQTVKILRRPTQSSEPRGNGIRQRQPIKTLQQREQEYAEARLRILGSAKNPEDDAASASNSSNATTTATTPATTTLPKSNSSPKLLGGNGNNGGGGANVYNNHYHQQQQQQLHQSIQQQQQQQNYYYQLQQQQLQSPAFNNRTQPQQQTWSPIVGGSVSSPTLRQQFQQQQHLNQLQQDRVPRLPRGPDGSHGFQMRR